MGFQLFFYKTKIDRSKKSKMIFLTIFILSAYLGLNPVVKPSTGSPKQSTVSINVLTRHSSSLFNILEEGFKQSSFVPEGLDVDIVFKALTSSLWKPTIDDGDIDLAWGGGSLLFDQLLSENLLEPVLNLEILSEIQYLKENEWNHGPITNVTMFQNGTGNQIQKIYWIGSIITSLGLVIDNASLTERELSPPIYWSDLAHPNYYFDDPIIGITGSSSFTATIYESIIHNYGWQLGWGINAMIAGNSLIYSGIYIPENEPYYNLSIFTTIDSNGYWFELHHQNQIYLCPRNPSILGVEPIAFTKNTVTDQDRFDVAESFVKFLLSTEGQSYLLDENIMRTPIRNDVFENISNVQDIEFVSELPVLFNRTKNNIEKLIDEEHYLNYYFSMRSYWEAVNSGAINNLSKVMKSAKNAIATHNMTDIQQLKLAMALGKPVGNPVFTEEIAENINKNMTSGKVPPNIMSEWTSLSNEKYQQIIDQLDNLTLETDFGISNYDIAKIDNPFGENVIFEKQLIEEPILQAIIINGIVLLIISISSLATGGIVAFIIRKR
ncbi:MAG: hypothetical protein HeimC3_23910 [Candidatus Heimdallarchaeota archaeon LC_3]|nr:MAG: hypothetical protein HeimC3_23910 [Candidatus Heimdallarchaeota archaeon LC_3]